MKVRSMLEEEEKLHLKRIHAKLPKVVSETCWNFISTINNRASIDDVLLSEISESATLVFPTEPITNDENDIGSGISTPITIAEAFSNVVSSPSHQISIGSPEDSPQWNNFSL